MRHRRVVGVAAAVILTLVAVPVLGTAVGVGPSTCVAAHLPAPPSAFHHRPIEQRELAGYWALRRAEALMVGLGEPPDYRRVKAAFEARGFSCSLYDLTEHVDRRRPLEAVRSAAPHGGACAAKHPVACNHARSYWPGVPPISPRILSVGYTLVPGRDEIASWTVAFNDPTMP